MPSKNCECPPKKKTVDNVGSLLINSHLTNTRKDVTVTNEFIKNIPSSQTRNCGIYTEVRERPAFQIRTVERAFLLQARALLQPEPKSRFEEFDILMRESVYKSQQDELLGMQRKALTIPETITITNRTFGIPTKIG